MQANEYDFAKKKNRRKAMRALLKKAAKHLQEKLPFVLYSKPNMQEVVGFFQKDATLFQVVDFSEKGFVLSSFDGKNTFIIPEDRSEIMRSTYENQQDLLFSAEQLSVDTIAKNDFESLVAKGIESINNNEFKKVVLSRKEIIATPNFDAVVTFEKLLQLYTSTFVYFFYHPKVGTWMGATPEQLLKVADGYFETTSLAGTQKDNGQTEVVWGKKEQEEQQFVTDYIVSELSVVASKVAVTRPYSIKAGDIWHIKTDISGRLNGLSDLKKIIALLHPTPAVCGLPRDNAKTFIQNNEGYDRSFYTGYLGELNSCMTANATNSDLFVNLRCMQIEGTSQDNSQKVSAETKAHLYMGCGITKDSVPEKEWEESINKSMTMKKVLFDKNDTVL